jgi:ABC-2 type transport system permease protein
VLRGLWKLTWLETKIFMREPMGAVGTIAVPVLLFVVFGRIARRALPPATMGGVSLVRVGLPVLAAILITLSTVISLVTIIAIYREGGILKRLRATPLRPPTILTAHVIVKLLLTAATLTLMVAAGRRYYPAGVAAPMASVMIALLLATWSILSLGFVIASLVPTARFAQPVAAAIFYPMIALSGCSCRSPRCRPQRRRWPA